MERWLVSWLVLLELLLQELLLLIASHSILLQGHLLLQHLPVFSLLLNLPTLLTIFISTIFVEWVVKALSLHAVDLIHSI